ncbi:hypothetical protein TNCT_76051 [Trichonephila clavata]|uniref:Uncharacterized protein n=1 Tax=Trichonephila clavata TaxID=2740835 RepID=A0A8X6LEC3_TRICU|nr:hypothetical protein TNCT_76051 [Trichonephila clavata]
MDIVLWADGSVGGGQWRAWCLSREQWRGDAFVQRAGSSRGNGFQGGSPPQDVNAPPHSGPRWISISLQLDDRMAAWGSAGMLPVREGNIDRSIR